MSSPIEQTASQWAEAKAHIQQIKLEYSLEGHDKLAKALSNALHM